MSELELTDKLEQEIEAMLATGAKASDVAEPMAELLGIATELRDLPRAEFKARLQIELEGDAVMSTAAKPATKTNPVREGFRTITPYLVVPDVPAEVQFLQQAFGAEGQVYGLGSQGGFHGEYKIGDAMVMIGGGGAGSAWKGEPFPASIHLYVQNVDAAY